MSEAVLVSLIAVSFEQFTWTYKTLGTSFSNTLYLFTNLYNRNREICNLYCKHLYQFFGSFIHLRLVSFQDSYY